MTYGNLWPRSMVAAETLEEEYGISAEVIDLRTVDAGYDRDDPRVAEQDRPHPGGRRGPRHRRLRVVGRVRDRLELVAPPTWPHRPRHPKFTRVSYGPQGEKAVMPSPDSVVAEALRILS